MDYFSPRTELCGSRIQIIRNINVVYHKSFLTEKYYRNLKYSTGNDWYLEHSHDLMWYYPQVNTTWHHHWWVNIGLDNGFPVNMPECADTESGLKLCCRHHFISDSAPVRSGMFIGLVSSGSEPIFSKFVCHYLGANEMIYSQTFDPTDFYLVIRMASNLIFRKQRRRSYIYPTWQCWIVISSTLIRGLWSFSEGVRCRRPASSLCFAIHAAKQSVVHVLGYAAASVTPGMTQNNARTVAPLPWHVLNISK